MEISGAKIVIETLIEQGCDTIFGYPGGQVIDLFDELYTARDRIRHVISAHEEGAAHAADGYARATGKVGVVIATSGPGATNLVTGIATAHLDSVPIVAITGNVSCELIGRDSFQEVDIVGVTMPITKHNFIVKDIGELADTLRTAFKIAKSGRPGPVLVDIPKDVQVAKYEFEANAQPVIPYPLTFASEEKLAKAAELINSAERPYIYFGGGVISGKASAQVMALADKIDAVMGCSLMGLSAVPHDHPRFLGMQGMHGHYASSIAENEADLVIALGARFSDRATGNNGRFAKNCRIIHIDIDGAELQKNIPADLAIRGDINDSVSRLTAMAEEQSHPQWRERIAQLRDEEKKRTASARREVSGTIVPYDIVDTVSAAAPDDSIIVTDVGQHQMWTAQRYPLKKPRTFLTSGGLGTMGYGLGAAIGASIATGKRAILFTGDGSFGMNLNELATAVSQELPITIIVMNNGVLGMVRQWQTLFYDKRYSNTTFDRKTDFTKVAEAFGAKGGHASSKEELEKLTAEAFSCSGPFLIDCAVDSNELVLPMLPTDGSVDNIITEIK
ncbi:biosynthetic-type acetolactate synthase large subunit [Ruminococcus flavefaciens]|uniref:biosynthetic-type acetolactate synthase large subunit n=1 Tax=Ruminococcus flavefaciens TaxID=1265 RepID=UPI0026EBA7C6|nr:biosynthetic-type acetolactate synthase large subunit [Ruminococcus flavefaciens]MDD7517625.1 biosynthetic-type acetolactate synthase large subunit [Ruminococcus flavefaciens]MDY5691315.1 biosynthetic-type acetolactate synthase large subunit [Ruminococcus flavefaciens]